MKKQQEHQAIGSTVASPEFPNKIDSFWFRVLPNEIVNPFDFVTIDNVRETRTVGIVNNLQSIDELGSLARASVIANTGYRSGPHDKILYVGMPLGSNKPVRFSTKDEVLLALGVPEMEKPIPAGLIEMTNGLQVPVSLDISYLLGPDTAHANASGISGNLKTTYLFFLLQSVYQEMSGNNLAVIIFNTKEDELLHIGEKSGKAKRVRRLFELLDIEPEPFGRVTYLMPRGSDGKSNAVFVPKNAKTYSFELSDIYDKLELLFGGHSVNISPVLNYIYSSWPLSSNGKQVKTWSDLMAFTDYPPEIRAEKSMLQQFLGQIHRFRRSPLFTDKKNRSKYIGNEIKNIKPANVFVIDISMIPTLEEQGLVVGDVMMAIDELYATVKTRSTRPSHILVFIDEINRFLPKSDGRSSAVADQIMKTVITGRSRGTILFSAQQFKSMVDPALHENTGLHVIAKLGQSELSMAPYSMLDKSTKRNIVRLNRGELVMIHPALRHPIKIGFPSTP